MVTVICNGKYKSYATKLKNKLSHVNQCIQINVALVPNIHIFKMCIYAFFLMHCNCSLMYAISLGQTIWNWQNNCFLESNWLSWEEHMILSWSIAKWLVWHAQTARTLIRLHKCSLIRVFAVCKNSTDNMLLIWRQFKSKLIDCRLEQINFNFCCRVSCNLCRQNILSVWGTVLKIARTKVSKKWWFVWKWFLYRFLYRSWDAQKKVLILCRRAVAQLVKH